MAFVAHYIPGGTEKALKDGRAKTKPKRQSTFIKVTLEVQT